GDRNDGRKLRTLLPMHRVMPYIMAKRSDAQNMFAESFDVTKVDAFCRQKVKDGYTSFGFLHVLIAAYVRMVAQYPAVNRFVSGQKIYSRNCFEVVMVVKKEMSNDSPDTCIKVEFEPTDTVDDVYRKFNAAVQSVVGKEENSSFDNLAKVLNYIPGLLLRWTVKLINFLDYFGLLPRWLTKLSPFHGSLILTSMGSLGIQPVYHHIYDFGNLPVFIAYGKKRTVSTTDSDGNVKKGRVIDIKVVMDERICDGFYFASAFKVLKRNVENPERLTTPPTEVLEDID
ncbi:MAG: hypothetical protein IKV16_04985, partial [Clostridia bacterium]|nr:hypothetical protein [Clostridia bacterium]